MFDRVLIQRAEAATKSKGGILIPEKAQQKVREGTVVAAGPGGRNEQTGATIPMAVKVRQNTLYTAAFLARGEVKISPSRLLPFNDNCKDNFPRT